MATRKAKSVILEELRLAAASEPLAVTFMEKQRWGDTLGCVRCGSVEVYRMMGRDGQRNKDYRWRCKDCKAMFTVRTGTVLEESRLSLKIWGYAIWKAASSKKGISALQLSREMEITHKSALFLLRRIRHGLSDVSPEKLMGTVEADEVYIGGRPRYGSDPLSSRPKTPVVGIVQRGGDVRFKVMPRVTAANLKDFIADGKRLEYRQSVENPPYAVPTPEPRRFFWE